MMGKIIKKLKERCEKQRDELMQLKFCVEKQIPQKPKCSDSGMFYICPNCNKFVLKHEKPQHGNKVIPLLQMVRSKTGLE